MRQEQIVQGQYYHIYNRGVNYQPIFFNRGNWVFFLRRLRENLVDGAAEVIAYCLMLNHYHFLMRVQTEDFGKNVMQPFTVSYTKAINKQQGRVGPLFQGPFQAKIVKEDRYLLHLSRYIHLNPVSAGLVKNPADWEFSSYQEYTGLRAGTLPKTDLVLNYFARNRVFGKNSVSGIHP